MINTPWGRPLAALLGLAIASVVALDGMGATFLSAPAAPPAPPFVPTDISGMALWLKADAGAFKDAGVTPAANNDTVQQWNDQSGNSNNASQGTALNRPTFKTSIIGSQPVIRCDGSSSFMATASIYPIAPNPYTLVVISIQRGASPGNLVSGDASGAATHALYYNSTDFVNAYGGDVAQVISTTSTGVGVTAFDILGNVGRSNGFAGSTQAINLTVNGNYSTGLSDSTTNSNAGLQLCAFAGGANFGNVDIAESLLYTKTLKFSDTNNIITYINSRYGTGVSTWPTDKQVIFDGDSITAGFRGQPPFVMLVANHEARYSVNLGSEGAMLSELVTQGATVVDPLFDASVTKNIVVAFAGTNDIVLGGASGATVAASAHQYCLDRHAAGELAAWVPMLPRGSAGNETNRIILNNTEAADSCWDAQVPVSCSAAMWAPGANTNLTNYNADQIHPNTTGHALIAACVETAVDSL